MPPSKKKKGAGRKAAKNEGEGTALERLMQQVNATYGEGTLLPAVRAESLIVDWIPTGIFDLDVRTGGGFPRGRITLIKGKFSSWKTALCYKGLSSVQRMCRFCGKPLEIIDLFGEVHEVDCKCGKRERGVGLWIDGEHVFDPEWASQWGVNCDDVLLLEPESAEQAIDVIDKAIRTRQCDLVVVDSIASLTPIIESASAAGDQQMGIAAKLFNKACRKWTAGFNSFGLLAKTKCTMLLINQLREKLGPYGGLTSPGGMGFGFSESLEIMTKAEEYIIDEATNRNVGSLISYQILKSKVYPPSLPYGEFALYFSKVKGKHYVGSTNTEEQVIKYGEYWKLIAKAGAWYTFKDIKVQGKPALIRELQKRPEYVMELMDDIRRKEKVWKDEGRFDETDGLVWAGSNEEKEEG